MMPSEVTKKNEKDVLQSSYSNMKIIRKPKFKIGQFVRINKHKHVFEKGYTPNWTTEIFKIRDDQLTNPTTYLLEDYQGTPIQGGFYEEELLKTSYPDLYLVEKVLKRRKNEVFVKWLGFPSKHNARVSIKKIL